ncbi:MAG: hypothetical protein H6713_23750 [Myxococcales bacterium]|nr:hypothetical protein [Myxococcales bacterium]
MRTWCAARRRARLVAALVTALVAPSAALADIAPPPSSVAHGVAPAGGEALVELFESTGDSIALRDAGGDVTLASESIELDLYPELLHVRARVELVVGPAARSPVTVGLPEAIPPFERNAPIEALVVLVDGAPVATRPRGAWINARDLAGAGERSRWDRHARLKSWTASDWWTWDVALAPGERVALDIEYVQLLRYTPRERGGEAYVGFASRTGAPWAGPVGEARVRLRLHGVPADALDRRALARALEGARDESSSAVAIDWSRAGFEPQVDLVIPLRVDAPLPAALPLAPDEPPGVTLARRVARVTSLRELDSVAALVPALQRARTGEDPLARRVAERALAELDRELARCLPRGEAEDSPCAREVDPGWPFHAFAALSSAGLLAELTATRRWLAASPEPALDELECERPGEEVTRTQVRPPGCRRSWMRAPLDPALLVQDGEDVGDALAPGELDEPEGDTPPLALALLRTHRRARLRRRVGIGGLASLATLIVLGVALARRRRRRAAARGQ